VRKASFAALLAVCTIGTGAGQDYPARPVHLVVPYTPGTGADILARVLGPKLGERWKVAVVTENKPGATGNIGAEFVAKSPPDGHTLLFTATSFGTNPALVRVPFDPVKSFAPVALAATSALALVVNPGLPAKTAREFIQLARRQASSTILRPATAGRSTSRWSCSSWRPASTSCTCLTRAQAERCRISSAAMSRR
jgi:tripartite-type tricarboxylate transporter receptor subunit TctC